MSLLNLKMEKTIKIVDCVRITMSCVAFEDELLAVLVGNQGNNLIAQLGQESTRVVRQSQLDNSYKQRGNMYRINVVRFLETPSDVLSSQVVSSGQKMI